MKRRHANARVSWGEWKFIPSDKYAPIKTKGLVGKAYEEAVEWRKQSLRYENNLYAVNITEVNDETHGEMWQWLSIKRLDREIIRDWRHLQRIKTELCGAEREAIEIFPPESQLVDSANQFHLWVLPEGRLLSVGFRYGRSVATASQAEHYGARQRAFELEDAEERNADVVFTASDIQEKRPDWSVAECNEFLFGIQQLLGEGMRDRGWDIINAFINKPKKEGQS